MGLEAKEIDALVGSSNVLKAYEQVELDILKDMARRIRKMDLASGTTKWQMEKLKAMNANKAYVYKTLSKLSGKSQASLYTLFDESSTKAIAADDKVYKSAGLAPGPLASDAALQQTLRAGMVNTAGTFVNLTNTTAIGSTTQFGAALDRAYMQVTSGAFTYDQAIKSAVNKLANTGVRAVTFPSGRSSNLYAATRRALLTGINQTALKVSEGRANQLGVDLVEVSSHSGARSDGSKTYTDHAWWQGKIYSRNGKSRKYPPLSDTGYGDVMGLGGANCRHSMYPFFEGISEKSRSSKELKEINAKTVPYNGLNVPEDKALAIQRSYERNVRKWKRREAVSQGSDLTTAKVKRKAYQNSLVDFTKQTGLKRDYTRERG